MLYLYFFNFKLADSCNSYIFKIYGFDLYDLKYYNSFYGFYFIDSFWKDKQNELSKDLCGYCIISLLKSDW